MKTVFVLSSRTRAVARLGCGVATTAGLTFTLLAASAATPQRGVRIGVEGAKGYACIDVCRDRLYQCLAAGTNSSICYYKYNVCAGGCAGGPPGSIAQPTQQEEPVLQ